MKTTRFEPPDWSAMSGRVEDVGEDFRNRAYDPAPAEASEEVVVEVEADDDFTKRGSVKPPVRIPRP